MQIESPITELPDSRMPIRTFKICTASLVFRVYIPASTPFVRNKRSAIRVGDALGEFRVFLDRAKAVVNRESGAFNGSEGLGKLVICLFGEDEI